MLPYIGASPHVNSAHHFATVEKAGADFTNDSFIS